MLDADQMPGREEIVRRFWKVFCRDMPPKNATLSSSLVSHSNHTKEKLKPRRSTGLSYCIRTFESDGTKNGVRKDPPGGPFFVRCFLAPNSGDGESCGLHLSVGGSAYARTGPNWMSQTGCAIGSCGDAGVVANEPCSAGIDVCRRDLGVGREVRSITGGEGGVDVQKACRGTVASVKPTEVNHPVGVGRDCRHKPLPLGRVVRPHWRGKRQAARCFGPNKRGACVRRRLISVNVIDKALAGHWAYRECREAVIAVGCGKAQVVESRSHSHRRAERYATVRGLGNEMLALSCGEENLVSDIYIAGCIDGHLRSLDRAVLSRRTDLDRVRPSHAVIRRAGEENHVRRGGEMCPGSIDVPGERGRTVIGS